MSSEARFAINISGQSLGADGFLDYIIDEFDRTGISPERVLFEITETSAIANLQKAMRFISVLKEVGCLFVLDDFGQGHELTAALAHPHRLAKQKFSSGTSCESRMSTR